MNFRTAGRPDYVGRDKIEDLYYMNVCSNVQEIPKECRSFRKEVRAPVYQVLIELAIRMRKAAHETRVRHRYATIHTATGWVWNRAIDGTTSVWHRTSSPEKKTLQLVLGRLICGFGDNGVGDVGVQNQGAHTWGSKSATLTANSVKRAYIGRSGEMRERVTAANGF